MFEAWLRVGMVFLIEPASLQALREGYHPSAEKAARVAEVVEIWSEGDGWWGTAGPAQVDRPELQPDRWGAPAQQGEALVWPGACPLRIEALPGERWRVDRCGTERIMVRWEGTDRFVKGWQERQVKERLSEAARQSPRIAADGAGWRIDGVRYDACQLMRAQCGHDLAAVCGTWPAQVGVWTEGRTLHIDAGSPAKCVGGGLAGFSPAQPEAPR